MGAKDTTGRPEDPGLGLIDQWLARRNDAAEAEEAAGDETSSETVATPSRPAPPELPEQPPAAPEPISSAKDRLAAARRANAESTGTTTSHQRSRGAAPDRDGEPPTPVAPRRFDLAAAREQGRLAEEAAAAEQPDAPGSDPLTAGPVPDSDTIRQPDPAVAPPAPAASGEPQQGAEQPAPVGSARERLAAQRKRGTDSRRNLAAEIFGAVNPADAVPEPVETTTAPAAPAADRLPVETDPPLSTAETPAVVHESTSPTHTPADDVAPEPVERATAAAPTDETPSAAPSPGLSDSDERRERLARMVRQRRTPIDDVAPSAPAATDRVPTADVASEVETTEAIQPSAPESAPAAVEPAPAPDPIAPQVPAAETPAAEAPAPEVPAAEAREQAERPGEQDGPRTETATEVPRRAGNGKHKAEVETPAAPSDEAELDTAVMEPALQAVLRAVEAAEREQPKKSRFRRGKGSAKQAAPEPGIDLRPATTEVPDTDDPAFLLDAAVARGLQQEPTAPATPSRRDKADRKPAESAPTRPAPAEDVTPPAPLDPMAVLLRATSAATQEHDDTEAQQPAARAGAEPTAKSEPRPESTPSAPGVVDIEFDGAVRPEPSHRPRTMADRAKDEARRAEAARAAIVSEVAGGEPAPVAVPTPRATAAPRRGDVPEFVKFSPRRSTRQLLGVLLFLALVGTIGTGYLAWDTEGTAEIAVAATMGLLTLILWSAFSTADPAQVSIERGVLDVVAKDSHYRFDLASPYTEVTVKGAPGKRNWQVQIMRRSMPPYVVDSSMVDPHEFHPILEHYRAEAERNAVEASKRRSRR